MSIQLKVACAPKEVDDALWLRHEVYVKEEGKYGGHPWPDERLVDRFDVLPKSAQILAYEDDCPVAGLRLNCDMGLGLPPETYFDFKPFLPLHLNDSARQPVVASAGMLVIRQDWRRRHDLLPALFRKAAGVFYSWDTTHIIAVVSHSTAKTYLRVGFKPLRPAFLIESIGDTVVPILAKSEDAYRWAFGETRVPRDPVWPERRRHEAPNHQGLVS